MIAQFQLLLKCPILFYFYAENSPCSLVFMIYLLRSFMVCASEKTSFVIFTHRIFIYVASLYQRRYFFEFVKDADISFPVKYFLDPFNIFIFTKILYDPSICK